MVKAVRGATTVEKDCKNEIIIAVNDLVKNIFEINKLDSSNVISVLFSITEDLVSINPAAALRADGNFSDIPLFCTQEPRSNNSLEKAIRVLITFNWNGDEITPVYKNNAKYLRPDLTSSNDSLSGF